MLSPQAAEKAAMILHAARTTVRPIDGLPEDCRPHSEEDAHAIQDLFTQLWGRQVGFKIGGVSEASQAMAGGGPFVGRLLAETCFNSGALLAAKDFHMIGAEAEFAFVIGDDLRPKETPYTRDDVGAAVVALQPVIEICDIRLSNWRVAGVLQLIADNAFHGVLIKGAPYADWRHFNLETHEASLAIDGIERGRGPGSLVMGNPLAALAWMVNDIHSRGGSLKAGDLIAAGTCTGLHQVHAGSNVMANFGNLGRVEFGIE